jgi:hypothetical protein
MLRDTPYVWCMKIAALGPWTDMSIEAQEVLRRQEAVQP